jgi:hypothetical protein
MLVTSQSPGMLTISSAYAGLMLHSTGPAGGYLDTYATACERIAYVLSMSQAYAQLMLLVVPTLPLLRNSVLTSTV